MDDATKTSSFECHKCYNLCFCLLFSNAALLGQSLVFVCLCWTHGVRPWTPGLTKILLATCHDLINVTDSRNNQFCNDNDESHPLLPHVCLHVWNDHFFKQTLLHWKLGSKSLKGSPKSSQFHSGTTLSSCGLSENMHHSMRVLVGRGPGSCSARQMFAISSVETTWFTILQVPSPSCLI